MDIEGLWIKVGAKFDEVEKALAKLPFDAQKAATEMEQAFKQVGIRNLEKEFRDAQAAFDLLERSGTLTAKQLADAADNVKAKWAAWKEELDTSGASLQQFGQNAIALGGALTAAVTAPIIALGTEAFKAAESLDGAFDKIRVGTGATGAQLDALQGSFRNLFANVPDEANQVANALTEISKRTGQVGPGLENLTRQFLDLSRITGEQIGPAIAKTTRLFGDWSIEASKQAGTMDMLFRVSQQTGISFTGLADKLVYAGAPFRQLGFSIEQSAIMLGKFEKEGVNVELVIGAMRTALAKFGKAGDEPVEAFRKLVESIKNADVAQGNLIAAQVVGTKRMADFAAAVREGRLDLDGLFKTVMNSGETIKKAAEDTADYGEAWQKLKNQVTLALEPLGAILFNTLTKIVQQLQPAINLVSELAKNFASLPAPVQTAAIGFAALAAAVGPVMVAVGGMAAAWPAVVSFSGALTSLKTVLAALAPIAIAAAGAFVGFAVLHDIAEQAKLLASRFLDLNEVGKKIDGAFSFGLKVFQNYEKTMGDVAISVQGALLKVGKSLGLFTDDLKATETKTREVETWTHRLRDAFNQLSSASNWWQALKAGLGPLGAFADLLSKVNNVVGLATGKFADMDQAVAAMARKSQDAALASMKISEAQLQALASTRNLTTAQYDAATAMAGATGQAVGGSKAAAAATREHTGAVRTHINAEADLAAAFQRGAAAADAKRKAIDLAAAVSQAAMDRLTAAATKAAAETERAFEALQTSLSEMAVDLQAIGNEGVAYLESLGIGIGELSTEIQTASREAADQVSTDSGRIQTGMKNVGKETDAIGRQISTVFTDFSRNIADAILKWDGFAAAGKKAVMAVAEVMVRSLVEGAMKSVMKGLSSITDQLGGIGRSISGLFGGGASSAAGSAGSAGGSAGGAAGAAGGVLGTIGAIGSIGSLISGVIGNFQMSGMNKTLDLIEKEVRYSQIHLKNILEYANTWWPWLDNLAQLQRLESIERVLYEQTAILDAGLRLESQGAAMGDAQQTMMNWLKAIAEGVWATYSAVAKPGWQTTPPRSVTPSTGLPITGGGGPGSPNTTVNVQVVSNSSNPYNIGLQVAQGINAILPART